MAFLSGLLSQQAGAADQKVKAYHDAITQAADYRQIAEQQRQFDAQQAESKRRDDATISRDAALDAHTAQQDARANRISGADLHVPPQFFPPHNATPEERARKLQLLAEWYEQQGATGPAAATRASAALIPTSGLGFARTAEVKNHPKELNDKLVAQEHMLQARLGAHSKDVIAQIGGRLQNTQLSIQGRKDVATMVAAEAYRRIEAQQAGATKRTGMNIGARNAQINLETEARIYGIDLNALTREKTDEYNQQMENVRAETRLGATAIDPTAPGYPQPPANPPVNVNLDGLFRGFNLNPLPTNDKAGKQNVAAQNKQSDPVEAHFAVASKLMRANPGPESLKIALSVIPTLSDLSPQQKGQLEARLRAEAGGPPKPLPLAGPRAAPASASAQSNTGGWTQPASPFFLR